MDSPGSVGGTLRQSILGFEVFGPDVFGAHSSGNVNFDFGGGFPATYNGVNSGLVRLRTAAVRLDWKDTSVIAGQDGLFLAPQPPTSFASLIVPALTYSGNLWSWTPQLRVEHRFEFSNHSNVSLQGGVLDPLTGEPPNDFNYVWYRSSRCRRRIAPTGFRSAGRLLPSVVGPDLHGGCRRLLQPRVLGLQSKREWVRGDG